MNPLEMLKRHGILAREISPLIFHKKELRGGPQTAKVFERLAEWTETYGKIRLILDKYEEKKSPLEVVTGE